MNDIKIDVQRKVPQALDSEKIVLSVLMSLDPTAAHALECFERLTPESFFAPGHGQLASWIQSRVATDLPRDITALASEIATNEIQAELFAKGFGRGQVAISTLIGIYGAAPTAAHFSFHVGQVAETHLRRKAIKVCMDGVQALYEGAAPAEELVVALQDEMTGISLDFEQVQSEKTVALATLAKIEKAQTSETPAGYTTSLTTLDEHFQLRLGCMIIIAARTSMGKTTMALQLTDWLTDCGLPSLVITKEMTSVQLMAKLLSKDTGRNAMEIDGSEQAANGHLMQAAGRRSARDAMSFRHVGRTNVQLIETMIRVYAMRGTKVFMIDYLQLIEATKATERLDRRHQIAEITRRLKSVAQQLDVMVLLVSQINRIKTMSKGPNKPTLEDLSESKTIEEDADAVILMHRQLGSSTAEVQIAKDRHGATTGWLELKMEAATSQFLDA